LILSVNYVEDISVLSGMYRLQTLQLHMNRVSDISVLTQLASLNELGLMGNSVSSIEALVHNGGLGTGDTVDLCDNPLDAISVETYIPQLQTRGVICLSSP
jgi:Leucine-rich repeat (LRR) protein